MKVDEVAISPEVQPDPDTPEPALIQEHQPHRLDEGYTPANIEDMQITFIDASGSDSEDLPTPEESPAYKISATKDTPELEHVLEPQEPGTADVLDVPENTADVLDVSENTADVVDVPEENGTYHVDYPRLFQNTESSDPDVAKDQPGSTFDDLEKSTLTGMMLDFMESKFASLGSPDFLPFNLDTSRLEETAKANDDSRFNDDDHQADGLSRFSSPIYERFSKNVINPQDEHSRPPERSPRTSDGETYIPSRFSKHVYDSSSQNENLDHTASSSNVPQDDFFLSDSYSTRPEEISGQDADTRPKETRIEPSPRTCEGDTYVPSTFSTPVFESFSQIRNLDHAANYDVPQEDFELDQEPHSFQVHSDLCSVTNILSCNHGALMEGPVLVDTLLTLKELRSRDVTDSEHDLNHLDEATNKITVSYTETTHGHGQLEPSSIGLDFPDSTQDRFKSLSAKICKYDEVPSSTDIQKANEVSSGEDDHVVTEEPAFDTESERLERTTSGACFVEEHEAGPNYEDSETSHFEEPSEEHSNLKWRAKDLEDLEVFRGPIVPSEVKVDRRHEDVSAVKPVVPVWPVYEFEECGTAHPCSPHGEVPMTDCNLETHPHLGTGSRHSQEDPFGGGAKASALRQHVDTQDINTRVPVTQSTSDGATDPADRADNSEARLEPWSHSTDTVKKPTGVIVYIREFDDNSTRQSTNSDLQPEPQHSASHR